MENYQKKIKERKGKKKERERKEGMKKYRDQSDINK